LSIRDIIDASIIIGIFWIAWFINRIEKEAPKESKQEVVTTTANYKTPFPRVDWRYYLFRIKYWFKPSGPFYKSYNFIVFGWLIATGSVYLALMFLPFWTWLIVCAFFPIIALLIQQLNLCSKSSLKKSEIIGNFVFVGSISFNPYFMLAVRIPQIEENGLIQITCLVSTGVILLVTYKLLSSW
jgi:hypothetical protein